jgi:hypothetical protein
MWLFLGCILNGTFHIYYSIKKSHQNILHIVFLQKADHLEDLYAGWRCGADSCGQRPLVGCCEHGHIPQGSMKGGKFRD